MLPVRQPSVPTCRPCWCAPGTGMPSPTPRLPGACPERSLSPQKPPPPPGLTPQHGWRTGARLLPHPNGTGCDRARKPRQQQMPSSSATAGGRGGVGSRCHSLGGGAGRTGADAGEPAFPQQRQRCLRTGSRYAACVCMLRRAWSAAVCSPSATDHSACLAVERHSACKPAPQLSRSAYVVGDTLRRQVTKASLPSTSLRRTG